MSDLPVAIAGGGIAGLSAALALARAGRAVQLFERETRRTEEGAGLQLSPNATRHLRDWGVLPKLDGIALTPERVIVRRAADAAVLSELDLRDAEARWGAPFRVAHRADLHAALMAAAEADPQIVIHSGASVTGWHAAADRLILETEAGAFDAAAVVVADGVRSSLRENVTVEAKPLCHSGRFAWRTLVSAERCAAFARRPASNLWLGANAHLVHYPLRGGSIVNVVAIVADGGVNGEGDFWSRGGDPAQLAHRFAGWHKDARALIAAAETWRVWPLLCRDAPERLADGRIALTGDAAHPMMPFLAQGATQAISDAAALGHAFTRHPDPVVALRAYESARLATVRAVVAASERQATIYHLRGPAAAARDLAMRAAGPVGMRTMAGRFWRD